METMTSLFATFHIDIDKLIAFGWKILGIIVIFIVGKYIIRWVQKIVRVSFEKSKVDKGVAQFSDSLIKVILYVVLVIIIASNLGIESDAFTAILATGGVAIGLAFQGTLSNFAGGLLILFLKPFVVGDYIIENSGKVEGTVKEIQVFYTKLSTLDNKIVVIPNGTLSNSTVTNVTDRPVRQLDLKVGIGYNSDLKKAKDIIWGILDKEGGVINEEDRKVFVDSLADSSVVLGIRGWVKTEEYWNTRWHILEEIKLTFDREGIEIPYNQLTVHMAEKDN